LNKRVLFVGEVGTFCGSSQRFLLNTFRFRKLKQSKRLELLTFLLPLCYLLK
jgi:hypothetical protein